MNETAKVPLGQRRKLLRAFRKQYGITLTDLGKLAGLSNPMLSQFENGNRDLSAEAWTRVLKAMSDLITEDNTKRLAEIGKAKETAAKLGAPGLDILGEMLSGKGPFGFAFKTDEQIAKEAAEIEAERIRLEKASEISALIVAQADELQKDAAQQIAQMPREEIMAQYCALWASADKLNRELRGLEAQGYALFLKSDVEAKERRIAELEQELQKERSDSDD